MDTHCSTPKIEHFNNYDNTGTHVNNIDTSPTTKKSISETSIFKYELYSLYTKPGVEVFVSSASHKPPLTFYRMFDPEVMRIIAYMNQGIQDFMTGKVGADEIAEIIENAYRDILSYNISLGNTDGTCPHYNARLLYDTQVYFAWQAVSENIIANGAERDSFARENYGKIHGQDIYEYYNSKYFHFNKELQEIGKVTITQIAKNEGFDFFDAQAFYNTPYRQQFCFNAHWQMNAIGMSMKDLDIEPPKDFTFFFTPTRYNQEDWLNGAWNSITAINPSQPDDVWGFHILVPRGWSLFKSLPLWMTHGTFTDQDGHTTITWDISKLINFTAGDCFKSRVKEFFDEFVNNTLHGDLVIWSGGTKSTHDVLFDHAFEEKRKFDGSELTSAMEHNSFVSNFEFRIF
jgi:hypothetical protein